MLQTTAEEKSTTLESCSGGMTPQYVTELLTQTTKCEIKCTTKELGKRELHPLTEQWGIDALQVTATGLRTDS
jgi:hypothetical protein